MILLGSPFGTIDPSTIGGYYSGPGGTTGGALAEFIRNALNAAWLVAGLATFIYLAVGGFRYITAGGDQKATQEAGKQITGAITGLAIIIGSYALVKILGVVFGIDIFKPVFKGP